MVGFQKLLGISSMVGGPTYKGLYKKTWAHPNAIAG
jgi:hypothetical protein